MASQVHVFEVAMTCEGCANAVRRVLGKLGSAVSNVEINLDDKSVKVSSTLSKDEIFEALKKTGKPVAHLSSQ